MNEWEETRQTFCRIAAKLGVSAVAQQIPAGRDTVYRLLRGQTDAPTLAVQAGIKRIVKEHTNGPSN